MTIYKQVRGFRLCRLYALVASRIVDMQIKLENLNINGAKTRLKINHGNEMECLPRNENPARGK